MTIGQRIKEARKNAGLTQKELGARLGVAYQTLAQWENDLRNPKQKTIQRIADALGVSFSYLQGWDEAMSELYSAGMSIVDLADELNIPVDKILDVISSREPGSAEAIKKIAKVAQLMSKEKKKELCHAVDFKQENCSLYSSSSPGKGMKLAVKTPADNELQLPNIVDLFDDDPAFEALLRIGDSLEVLNDGGVAEAIKRVEELTEIPKYRKRENQKGENPEEK